MEIGLESKFRGQMADLPKPLNAISEMCDAGGNAEGQCVVFGRVGGAVINMATGGQTLFACEDSAYTMDVWVKLDLQTDRNSSGTVLRPIKNMS